MSGRALRPGDVAAAALVIGGAITLLLPQYGLSILRLVIVTAAAGSCVYALAVNVPVTWSSPFDRTGGPGATSSGSDEVQWLRSKLRSRRQSISNGPPIPPEILRTLQPLIRTALGQDDPLVADPAYVESFRWALSPLTWSVLNSDPLKQPIWLRTRWPNPREVAEVVHHILDDLDGLAASGRGPHHAPRIDSQQEP